jgi:hypothetical protein
MTGILGLLEKLGITGLLEKLGITGLLEKLGITGLLEKLGITGLLEKLGILEITGLLGILKLLKLFPLFVIFSLFIISLIFRSISSFGFIDNLGSLYFMFISIGLFSLSFIKDLVSSFLKDAINLSFNFALSTCNSVRFTTVGESTFRGDDVSNLDSDGRILLGTVEFLYPKLLLVLDLIGAKLDLSKIPPFILIGVVSIGGFNASVDIYYKVSYF